MIRRILIYGIVGVLALGALGMVSAAGGAYYMYRKAVAELPGFTKITDYNPPLVTTVYTANDEVLGYFYKEKRFLRTLDRMPEHLPMAFLAAEDNSFYQHDGVDLQAIFRALIKNVQAGHVVQGGSTITQQLIKSLLLTPERSYERKLKEAILAYRIEHHLTKDEILTIYLNQIFFGARAYGVEAAARAYFGKHVEDLTLAESALLAGLPKAPTAYNPYKNPEGARTRQLYVLGRMRDMSWITMEEYQAAVDQEMEFKAMPDPSWGVGAYYLEEVRRLLIDRYGEETVYKAGLKVKTAMNFRHQAAAEEALRWGLEESAKRRGWTRPIKRVHASSFERYLQAVPYDLHELKQGDWVKALVTEVEQSGASVMFGEHKGVVKTADMAWAREPNPKKAHDFVPDIKDATTVLNVGDVVWASLKEEPAEFLPVVDNATTTDHASDEQRSPEQPAEARQREIQPAETPAEFPDRVWSLALEREPDVEGALVSVEPENGYVPAMVGGYNFHRSQFNRATQAWRQPGSAFKPIVYSAAIDNGLTPASMILDAPIVYNDIEHNRLWKPSNFEGVFYGPTLLRTALVKSRNLVTIRVADRIGIRSIIDRAREMGLETEFPEDLSVSLGSAPVTLINLCQAYTAFARGGSIIKPRLILSVEGPWGEKMFESKPETREAVSPQTAYVMATLMKDVVRYGTGKRAKVLGRPVAGKTGTTNDEQDAWFMGYTPYLLSGVYVGFDQLTPMGQYETGSRAASPIWVRYRQAIEEDYPPQDFKQPQDVVMMRINAKNGLPAGPSAQESYFLPFKAGTQPVATAVDAGMGGGSAGAEDLLKQIF